MDTKSTPEKWIGEKLINEGFISTKQIVSKLDFSIAESIKELTSFYDTYQEKINFTALYRICIAKNDAYRFDFVLEENLPELKSSSHEILVSEIAAIGRKNCDIVEKYFNENFDDPTSIGKFRLNKYPKKRHPTTIDTPQTSTKHQEYVLSPKKVTPKEESLVNSKKQKQELGSFFKKPSTAKVHVDVSSQESSMTTLKADDPKKSNKTLILDPSLFSADSSPESSPSKKITAVSKRTENDLESRKSKKRKSKNENTKNKAKNGESLSKQDEMKAKTEKEGDVKTLKEDEGPIKRQKMVHNTYLDEDGYLVTMKESRTEILSNSEQKSKTDEKMKNGSSEPTKSSVQNGKSLANSKPTKKDGKTATGKAQSTLTSFFKK